MLIDPLSALSLAAAVVQFVDFTTKVLVKGNQIYKSAEGVTRENVDLNSITLDLLGLTERMVTSMHNSREVKQLSMDEQALEGVAVDCSLIAQDLLDNLEKLKLQGKKTKLKSLHHALKSVWNKGSLEEIQTRLERYREELNLHLLASIREQIDLSSIDQSERFDHLDRSAQLIVSYMVDETRWSSKNNIFEKLANLYEESEKRLVSEHEKTRSEIRAALQHRDRGGDATAYSEAGSYENGSIAVRWEDANPRQQREMSEIRDVLWFPEINERIESVSENHKNTFDWIYRDPIKGTNPWSNFTTFLQGEASIYWINGKPGSGKSTLMKYLYHNRATQKHLQHWSQGHKVASTAFFFWNSGTQVQNTLESFFRTILFRILKGKRGCSELIPIVLEEQLTTRCYKLLKKGQLRWSMPQLKRAFLRLVHQTEIPVKLFFMIDGLDECEGSHDELVKYLLKVRSPSVKMLLSSRPWNIFMDAFKEEPQLRLQDLTNSDITLYVEDNLKRNERMQRLLNKDPVQAEALSSEIVLKASGVFLWVRVVVGSLIDGLRNHDRIAELQARLLLLPSDLAEVYQHILTRMDLTYQYQRTKYLLMRQAAKDPPLTLVFSLADEEDDELCFNTKIGLMTRGEAFDRCEELERRLEASCAGLIEINFRSKLAIPEDVRCQHLAMNDYRGAAFGSRIQYLHRTVRDFFESEKYAKEMEKIVAGTDFDPNIALLRGWILRLKVLPHPIFLTLDLMTGDHPISPTLDIGTGNREVGATPSNSPFTWWEGQVNTMLKEATNFARLAEMKSGVKPQRLIDELQSTIQKFQKRGSCLQYGKFEQYQYAGLKIEENPEASGKTSPQQPPGIQVLQRDSEPLSRPQELVDRKPRKKFKILFCCYP